MRSAWGTLVGLCLAVSGAWDLGAAPVQDLDANLIEHLPYRFVGPVGNRVSAVAGVADDPKTYYVGAASGGVFKTEDGGTSWKPVFDDQPVLSIGALAVASSDPKVVWAGTGEAHIRSNVSIGNGIYRSLDGGASWEHRGLPQSGRISRIVIDPRDPQRVLVAVLGHCYGPQPERGVFLTEDGGESWDHVLFVDPDTGASDIIIDPNNPRILYAATWQMRIWTWGRVSGGPGSGIYKSTDSGRTWVKLEGKGLPKPPWGKVALAISADDSERIYALIETNSNRDFAELQEHQGVLWRSDDAGARWSLINSDHTLAQRPIYYTRVVASPQDSDTVYFLSTRASVSRDGGRSYANFPAGGDHHDMWIDPGDSSRMIVGHDQGVSISVNGGKSWNRPQLPIAQMYHVHTDNRIPYRLYGNRQDGPSMAGPSNTLTGGPIAIGAWHSVGGCESGFAIPDPSDPDIVWSGCYEGILERYDGRTGHSRNVSVWPDNPEAWAAETLKYRFQWTFPIVISPHDPRRVYVGSQYVHLTTDRGQTWRVISPDLTTDDPEKQQRMGGLTPDDAGPTIATVLFALAESPLEEGVLWAGSNDGLVHVSRDGGGNWENVTSRIPDLPPWGTISNIEPSRHQAGAAYLTIDFHQLGDTAPYLYKTEDYGQSWVSLRGDLPHHTHSYAHCLREDPRRAGLLYLGTENALYVSFNDGRNWHPLQSNLPHAPVHWLTIQEDFNDLVVATYGRGFWILDDVTPLQQLTDSILEQPAHLFVPRPAYRFRYREGHVSQPGDPAQGHNPPYGASLHYYLREEPKDLEITILNSAGEVVRKLENAATTDDSDEENHVEPGKATRHRGINRVYWDLRHERTSEIKLRTRPEEHSHVAVGDKGWRPLAEGRRVALLAPPGVYTVRLRVDDQEWTQKLEVLKDPAAAGDESTIARQQELLRQLHQMIDESVAIINEIEVVRAQLEKLAEQLSDHSERQSVLAAVEDLQSRLKALENNFFDLRLSGARQDTLWWGRRLYSKMTILASQIGQTDLPPTAAQQQVFELYREQMNGYSQQMKELREVDIPRLNELLSQNGILYIAGG